jgi:two-component system, chemotaxis family, CheB/CheR fusion protein
LSAHLHKATVTQESLAALLDYLQQHYHFDFHSYSQSSLRRRLQLRLQSLKLESHQDYLEYLQRHPEEAKAFFDTVFINYTSFFRDALTWNYLAHQLIPRLLASKQTHEPIRIWSAGCASGEEAYTLAMLLAEVLGEQQLQRVKIFATDVDSEAIVQARQATYSRDQLLQVPQLFCQRYFKQVDQHYILHPALRKTVIFARHHLLEDAPFSRLDLLLCRNVLIYYNQAAQTRALVRFYLSLREGGLLFLGNSETLSTCKDLFAPLNLRRRIFSKVPGKINPKQLVAGLGLQESS